MKHSFYTFVDLYNLSSDQVHINGWCITEKTKTLNLSNSMPDQKGGGQKETTTTASPCHPQWAVRPAPSTPTINLTSRVKSSRRHCAVLQTWVESTTRRNKLLSTCVPCQQYFTSANSLHAFNFDCKFYRIFYSSFVSRTCLILHGALVGYTLLENEQVLEK